MYSIGSKPLQIWNKQVCPPLVLLPHSLSCQKYDWHLWPPPLSLSFSSNLRIDVVQVRNGHIKRITDQDIQSLVIDIASSNVRCVFGVLVSEVRCVWVQPQCVVVVVRGIK
jgi:hypothetical protein